MKQRLKGFIFLISIIFLIAYVTSEYYAKKVNAEVDIYKEQLSVLYNAHEVVYRIMAIQEGLYSVAYGSFKDPELVKLHFPELEKRLRELSTSVGYIYFFDRADELFKTYSHHVDVIETIYPKYFEKVKTAIEAKEGPPKNIYIKEAIATGEGLEVIVKELDKLIGQQYEKTSSSLPTVTARMRGIRNVTGILFFNSIVLLSILMFYSCKPFKRTLLPFLKAIKAGDYAYADKIAVADGECTREIISTFNTIIRGIKEGEKASESLTITDGLTGVYNRRYFDMRLDEEMNRSIRYGNIFSLSIIDIDHFKVVNDAFGHQVGDSVLKEVVMLIKDNSRETDIVARYGGEEFVIIYPCTPKSGVLTHIERLREVVECHKFKDLDRKVTISIGAADSSGKNNAYQIVQEADTTLYMAKSKGRNRCVIAGITA